MKNMDKNQDVPQELRKLAPGLAKLLPEKRVDDLPFRYFEKLPDQVINRLKDEEVHRTHWIDRLLAIWNSNGRLVLAFASILAVVLIGGIFFNSSNDQTIDLADVNPTEIQSYLMSHADDLDDAQLTMLSAGGNSGNMEILHVSDEELQPVLDDYLFQVQDVELN